MPQDILSALQRVSPQRALRLASSIGGLAYGGTDRLTFGTLSHEQIGRTRHMSSQNGDKARFNRLRKQKLRRRELTARLATQSAASAARLGKTPPAKLGQR
jgi:hypothetical protein